MQLSDGEWKVMTAVWKRHPTSARGVLENLPGETSWAYTTLKTIMSRLVEKGVLKVHKRANTSIYEPLLTRNQARASALKALVDRAFDGAVAPMMAFLVEDEQLSSGERAELQRLLDEELSQETEDSR